jgi:hypothetical protein
VTECVFRHQIDSDQRSHKKCLADCRPHLQPELLLPAQLSGDDLTRIAENVQPKANLLIDGFCRRPFAQSIFLVVQDCCSINIDSEFVSDDPLDVPKCVVRKPRPTIAKPVSDQVLNDDFLQRPDPLFSGIADVKHPPP